MLFLLKSRVGELGTWRASGVDTGMGVADGEFSPNERYSDVQPVFWKWAELTERQPQIEDDHPGLRAYYAERDALRLELVDASGSVLQTECIHISDYTKDDDFDEIALSAWLSSYSDVAMLAKAFGYPEDEL